MISYEVIGSNPLKIAVRMQPHRGRSKIIGHIQTVEGGYQYKPLGSKLVGDTFATVPEVKRSLEEV